MANIKISALPSVTASTTNDYLVINNSSETTTSKIQLKNLATIVPGSGTNSIRSGSITASPATASNTNTIAIGNGASATGSDGITIGTCTNTGQDTFVVGKSMTIAGNNNIYIGKQITNTGSGKENSVIIGANINMTNTTDGGVTYIGYNAVNYTPGRYSIGVGLNSNPTAYRSISIGISSTATQQDSTAVGSSASATGVNSLALGYQASVTASGATAIGYSSSATAAGAIAIGDVTASDAGWTKTRQYQFSNYAALDFADDTAAAAGGVPLGGIYHNSGALRVRIV